MPSISPLRHFSAQFGSNRFGKVVAAALLSLLVTGCGGLGSASEAEYLERAARHLSQDNFASAIIEYRNALSQNPAPTTRAQLGIAYNLDNQPRQAINHLQRALAEGADPDVYALPLARILLDSGLPAEIGAIPEADGLDSTAKAQLLGYRALGNFLGGEVNSGRAHLRRAESLEGGDVPEVHLARAYEAMFAGDAESALRAVQAAINTGPGFASSWSLKGDLHRDLGDLTRSVDAYDQAIALRPNHILDRLKRGIVNVELGRFEAAQADADFVRRRAAEHPGGHFLLGFVHYENHEPSRSRPYFEEALATARNFRLAMPYLSALHIEEGRLVQAEHLLERFHALGEPTAMSYRLLVRLRMAQGQPNAARALLNDVLEERPHLAESVAYDLVKFHLDVGESATGVEILRDVVSRRSDHLELQEMLGVALLEHGDRDEAIDVLRRVATESEDVRRGELAMANEDLRAGRYDTALEAASRLLRKDPENPEFVNIKAMALLGLNQVQEARRVLEEGVAAHPDHHALLLNLSSLDIRQGNEGKARERLEAFQERHPGEPQSAMRLAALDFREGAMQAGQRWLVAAIENDPEAVDPYMMLASAQAQAGDNASAAATLTQARMHHPDNPRIIAALGEIQERQRNFEAATKTLQDLVELWPEDAEAHFALARSLAGRGDDEGSIRVLRRTIELDPAHLAARMVLTRHLVKTDAIDEARIVFAPVAEAAPESAMVLAQRAWFDALDGHFDRAASGYQRALEHEQRREWAVAKFEAEMQAGQFDAAVQTLMQWLQQQPRDDQIRHRLGQLLVLGGLEQVALEHYEFLLERRPDDVIAMNNVAWLVLDTDGERALDLAERANSLRPDQPAILDTLGKARLRLGEPRQARAALERAWELAPEVPGIGYSLAQARHLDGDSAAARRLLAYLLDRYEDFPEREAAQNLLNELEK